MAARKASAKEPVVAVATFQAEVDGDTVLVRAGDVVPASAAVVRKRKDLFVPQSKYVQKSGASPRSGGR
jgi:hypothetical protein